MYLHFILRRFQRRENQREGELHPPPSSLVLHWGGGGGGASYLVRLRTKGLFFAFVFFFFCSTVKSKPGTRSLAGSVLNL